MSAGRSLDRRLVEAAALLHDVDKLPAVRPTVADTVHGAGSAEWLARRGYPELGDAIIGHPVTRLADGPWFDRWFAAASIEALVVAYADKRAGQKVEPMAERFASWERRYPPDVRAGKARGELEARDAGRRPAAGRGAGDSGLPARGRRAGGRAPP